MNKTLQIGLLVVLVALGICLFELLILAFLIRHIINPLFIAILFSLLLLFYAYLAIGLFTDRFIR